MTLRVSGKNLAIGEALRTHVHSRIDGVVAKYHAGSPSGHVTIEPEGSGYRADCTLFLKAGITLQVEAVAHEVYASFDKAADRIERRLRDHKKRIVGHHPEPSVGDLLEPESEPTALSIEASEPIPEETFPAVVAEHAHDIKEMTVAAAVRALETADCPVMVFRYAENRRINLVYRRADGHIGWLDPLGASNGRSG